METQLRPPYPLFGLFFVLFCFFNLILLAYLPKNVFCLFYDRMAHDPLPDRLKIHHEESFRSDKLVAWACIRLDRLRTGYRLVGLRDASTGAQTTGSVLVNLQVRYQK